jgi:hypothetical protein
MRASLRETLQRYKRTLYAIRPRERRFQCSANLYQSRHEVVSAALRHDLHKVNVAMTDGAPPVSAGDVMHGTDRPLLLSHRLRLQRARSSSVF